MTKTFCVFTMMFCAVAVTAQNTGPSVIASASGSGKTSTLYLNWTLGEIAVETVVSPSLLYTQGFNQPNLLVSTIFTKPLAGEKVIYDISVAPNPVVSTLNFTINSTTEMEVMITVSDVNGKVHLQRKVAAKSSNTQLNFTGLVPGTYILSVRKLSSSQLLKSFQIIKL